MLVKLKQGHCLEVIEQLNITNLSELKKRWIVMHITMVKIFLIDINEDDK